MPSRKRPASQPTDDEAPTLPVWDEVGGGFRSFDPTTTRLVCRQCGGTSSTNPRSTVDERWVLADCPTCRQRTICDVVERVIMTATEGDQS